MKKWFITFCTFCLIATVGTQASAAPVVTEDNKQNKLFIYTIKFHNVNGLIFRTFKKLPILNEAEGNRANTINFAKVTPEKIISTIHNGDLLVQSNNSVEETEVSIPKAPTPEISVDDSANNNEQEKTPSIPLEEETPASNDGKYYINKEQIHKEFEEIMNNFFKQYPSNEYNSGQNENVKKPTTTPANPAPTAPKESVETPTTPQQTTSSNVSDFERQVVELTNAERAKAGIAPLEIYGPLMNVAEAKSQDMANLGYFSHTSPTYGSPFDQIKAAGIQYRAAGENIAQGQRTPEQVVNAWMNSPGHRANILNASYTHIGVGFVENGYYWTQQFIQM